MEYTFRLYELNNHQNSSSSNLSFPLLAAHTRKCKVTYTLLEITIGSNTIGAESRGAQGEFCAAKD
jgi:hypothetical protein